MSSKSEDGIYRKLQKYLDSLPIDYPETESGVELRILRQLFTPQEAEIALNLKIIPQEPKTMFRPFKKRGWTLEQFSEALLTMAKKGSINWIRRRDGTNYYSIAFLMVGFYDYQIDKLTKDFSEDIDQYMNEGFISAMLENGILQMRTIPIEKSVSLEYNVSNFDEVKTIIENVDKTLYLCPCICRQSKEVQGQGCDHPKETCISIGANPRIFLKQGRDVTKDEALEVLRMAQDRGMVICPSNTQKPFIICCCCGCSCVVLTNLKKYPNPAQFINSNYFVEINKNLCEGCAECITSCHMEANKINEKGISVVNLDYCIGCGVCIPRCPNKARHLVKKTTESTPPQNLTELYQTINQRKAYLQEKRKVDKNHGIIKRIK
ncbi:MAG: 4Fe-4S binding protein [Candidatus Lokiarchaeota archaeon]|nr:4Fe-4S binding protein [Candidatus Lokiarchaeota archaeon]